MNIKKIIAWLESDEGKKKTKEMEGLLKKTLEKLEKAVSLSEEKYCSASAMLGKTATIEHTYRLETT